MTKTIIKSANIDIVDSRYPLHFTLELIHLDTASIFGTKLPSKEIIRFNITTDTNRDLIKLLAKYDDTYILIFEPEQRAAYHVRWITPDTISFSVSFYNTLQTKEYQFSAIDMKKLFPSTDQIEQKQNVCPECKGTGRVLLFTSDSPCGLCN